MSDWAPPEEDFKAAAWSPPETDFASAPAPDETVGRVAGLGARALGEGTADTASTITNAMEEAQGPLSMPLQAVQAAVPTATSKEPTLSDFIHPARWKNAVDYLADKAGLAKPETAGERIGSKAVEAVPSAVFAPEASIAGAASAMLGAGASQGIKEAGGGPLAQTIGGLAAGSVPAIGAAGAAGIRGIVRGGSEGQTAMQQRLADAETAGTTLSAGQAGGSPLVQYAEGLSSKGWGGGPINKLAEGQAEDLGDSVEGIVNRLSAGTEPSPTTAGTAVTKGAETAKDNMRAAESAAFNKRDALVPHATPTPIANTMQTLDKLATPTPGAEATTGALLSPKITTMRNNLTADATAAGATGPQNAMIPYGAVKQLRTAVGNSIDWGFAPADPVTNGALKKVYGSLSDDLTAGASAVSPEAKKAAQSANALYAQNEARRDFLNSIIDRNGGPEAVFKAATSGTKEGASTVSQVMGELQPDQQNLVRATVLHRLGRTAPSAQNAEGSLFSSGTFLTNWNKLAPEAKDALFGASGNSGDLRSNLDSLANTMSNIRVGTKLRNPSGSGEVVGHGAGAIALWEGLTHALQGEPHTLMATAGGVAANNIFARAMTNPKVVAWLARSTKAPVAALPNAVNQLSQLNDPDAKDLAGYLQQPAPIARASGGKVDIDVLVNRLIKRWHDAKRQTNESTKSLLKQPDAAIVRALDIAQEHL